MKCIQISTAIISLSDCETVTISVNNTSHNIMMHAHANGLLKLESDNGPLSKDLSRLESYVIHTQRHFSSISVYTPKVYIAQDTSTMHSKVPMMYSNNLFI